MLNGISIWSKELFLVNFVVLSLFVVDKLISTLYNGDWFLENQVYMTGSWPTSDVNLLPHVVELDDGVLCVWPRMWVGMVDREGHMLRQVRTPLAQRQVSIHDRAIVQHVPLPVTLLIVLVRRAWPLLLMLLLQRLSTVKRVQQKSLAVHGGGG